MTPPKRFASPGASDEPLTAILANLRLLLGTRLGDAAATPDFGVPDLCDFLHQRPATNKTLHQAVRAAIVRHEPRLRGVQVVADSEYSFAILAYYCDTALRLRIHLTPTGRFVVSEPC